MKSTRIHMGRFEDAYEVDIEYNEDYAILHFAHLDKINKDILMDMKARLGDIYKFFTTIGYECLHIALHEHNVKLHRLVKRLGFTFMGNADGLAVFQYREN